MWKIGVRLPSGKTSMSSLAIFSLFNSSNLILMSSWWRRRRINNVWIESVKTFAHTSNWLPTYCLHTMSDGWYGCGMLWDDIAWLDAPDVLRNLAVDFSSIGLLPSPAISNSAVDSLGNRTCQVTWLLQCTWILVRTICQTCCTVMRCGCIYSKSFEYSPGTCAFWSDSVYAGHLLLRAFDSSYVFFFSASFFFALIASTWHRLQEPSNLLWNVGQFDPSRLWKWELNKRSRTKPPDLSISHPHKKKGSNLITRVLATCSLICSTVSSDCWCLGSLGRCPSILHAPIF